LPQTILSQFVITVIDRSCSNVPKNIFNFKLYQMQLSRKLSLTNYWSFSSSRSCSSDLSWLNRKQKKKKTEMFQVFDLHRNGIEVSIQKLITDRRSDRCDNV